MNAFDPRSDDFDTHAAYDQTDEPRWRLPGVGVLLVAAVMVGCVGLLLALHVSQRGIRRVHALGGNVDYRWNAVSDMVSEFVVVDSGLLASDADVLTLWLSGPEFTDESLAVLRRFPAVEDMYLEESNVTDTGIGQLAAATALTDLQIYDNPGITDAGLAKLARLPLLRYLDIEGLQVTGQGIAAITQIEILYLDRCPSVDDVTLRRISGLPNLTDLSVLGSSVTDAGLVHLANLPRLSSLTLDETAITDEGLTTIVELCPGLRYLSLDDIRGITDEGVLQLVELKSLETLYVQRTRVSAEAKQKLDKALPRCDIILETDEIR